MESYVNILGTLTSLRAISNDLDERWGYIRMRGNTSTNILALFKKLQQELTDLGFYNVLQLEINNAPVDEDDLNVYVDLSDKITGWHIELNKLPVINQIDVDGWHYNFFTSEKNCLKWLTEIQPLLQDCPFNNLPAIRILVGDLNTSFGGEITQFLSPSSYINSDHNWNHKLPDRDTLRENIHFITSENINVHLKAFYIDPKSTSDLEKEFVYKACIALTVSLVNEYYDFEKVVVDGIKRIILKIDDKKANINYGFYNQLLELVAWVYEDRVSVRKKLFNERMSLDLDPSDALLKSLTKSISGAFTQAKERYSFVIIERKDAYVKELKELLKDIRTQSELYSIKIRNLLSNFLRDLLAAIILIGFTIFTKFSDNSNLANQDLLKYVFYGLAIYYVVSISMQSIIDMIDIYVSKREILYWKNATKELLPEKEFKAHIDASLKGRRNSLRIIYPLLIICYLLIAYSCYIYPVVFENIMKK